jgi:MYXO-CTERM domain-containing protein
MGTFQMMTRDEVAKSIGAAAHTWSPEAVTCTSPTGVASHPYLEVVPGMADPGEPVPRAVGTDVRNVILFVESGWVDVEKHESLAVAVTTLTWKKDGRVLDADIEINAEFDTWANIDPGWAGPPPDMNVPFDLQNAITHEFGHFIGLDHTCFLPGKKPRDVDNNGLPVPDCGPGAPLEVMQSVMYASIRGENQETSKRFLTPDDIAGICSIYPADRDPHVCSLDLPDDGCACTTSGAAGSGAGALGLAALALLKRRRRR